MNRRVQIKICGVTTIEDARACVALGADMIGLNFFRQSPRAIETDVARRIVEALPVEICAVGIFVGANANQIREVAHLAGIRSVQLHGETPPEMCRELAQECRVILAFGSAADFRPEDATLFPECAVLLDAPHPEFRGGTGRICDWPIARATLPFTRFLILSGGLNASNVGVAIETVGPHAVDVCSGVESSPGVKNHQAIQRLIAAVRS